MTLTKTGAGSQTLSHANTYTGATYVSQGTLTLTAFRLCIPIRPHDQQRDGAPDNQQQRDR